MTHIIHIEKWLDDNIVYIAFIGLLIAVIVGPIAIGYYFGR